MTDTIDTKPDPALAGTEAYFGPVTRRGTEAKQTTVKTPEDYENLKPGTTYLDPDGVQRRKSFTVTNENDYNRVPEGESYIDPEGKQRVKPAYQDVDFTANTLYNMSVNDKERQKALERSYPGKVKTGPAGLYVDDNGTLRRPKGMTESTPGFFSGLAGQTAPVVGSVVGEVGGGALGSAGGPVGTAGGAIAGGGAGGAAGQAFNDAFLHLAGVYDRTGGEELGELGMAGAFGAAGTAVGRGLAAIAPTVKGQVQNALPKAAAEFLGADEQALGTAIQLREKGVLVPPSAWAKESPHLQNVAEVFDPAFRTQKPLLQSATEHYEKSASEVLEGLGAKVEPGESIAKPTAAVSTEEAGVRLLTKAREESAAADAALRGALDARKAEAAARGAVREVDTSATREALKKAETDARKAAERVINAGFTSIQADIDTAMKATKAGNNSGELWWSVGEKLKQVKQGITARAKKMYGEADELAGGHLPDTSGLPETARDFLTQLPEGFEGKYPSIVKQLRDLAGVEKVDPKTKEVIPGEWAKEPVEPTFGQLHNLRSIMRQNINYLDLTPDIREGVYKFFAKHVDDVLHDPKAHPALQDAARALDNADRFYRENMGPLNDKNIQAVMNGLESGMPADPKILYNTLIKEGRSELTRKVRELVGPTLWAGIKAADMQEMLDASRSLVPGQIDGRKFASQVLDRYRSGMLEAVHDPQAVQKLLVEQAQNVAMLDGKLDMAVRPGDSVAETLGKARQAADAAKAAAKQDPLATLNKEMKAIQREHAQQVAKLKAERKTSPIGFLYDLNTGASEAVDRILRSEDLVIATARHFGDKSPEFEALRQVYAKRILQGTIDPSKRLAGESEEVQRLMFGASLEQMRTLAKEMTFLMSGKGMDAGAGLSMSATAKVEHPWSSIPGGKMAGKILPGFDAGGRAMLGKYYKMVTELSNNLAFLRWVEKGLKGDEIARERTKAEVQRHMRMGGAIGAAGGEATFQAESR